MMRRTDMTWTQLKVGIVIMVAVAALLYTIMNLNSGRVFSSVSTFYASLNDSQGVKAGAPVRISGVDVGNVKGVNIDPGKGKVLIEFTVSNEMRPLLHADAAIMIRPMGLLGDKYLELLPGSIQKPQLADGAILSGRGDTADITGVAGSATATLQNVDQTLRDLQKIFAGISEGKGTAGKLVTDPELYDKSAQLISKIDALTEKTGQLLAKVERGDGTLGRLITDRTLYDRANTITEELQKLVVTLNRPDGSIGRLARDPALYNKLESFATKGEGLADKIDRGEGTLGKLMTQDLLYKRTERLLTEMESLIAEIKKDPKKYFKFSVF